MAAPHERDALWRGALADASLREVWVSPQETSRNPVFATQLRAEILQRTYGNEYHTDTQDTIRLAQAVEQGRERIMFWGTPEAIRSVRRQLSDPRSVWTQEMAPLDLGTASVLDMSPLYGPGYAELSRTGSVCQTQSAETSILRDLWQLLHGDASHFASHHTFVALPRNRKSSAGVRGGAAIHRLHVRVIGSAFWGVAPWYVMQGGVIEVLDFRELYRDPEAILRLHGAVRNLWFPSEESKSFLASLIAFNFGESALHSLQTHIIQAAKEPVSGWELFSTAPADLSAFCPTIIRRTSVSGVTLNQALEQASSAASIAVLVPIEEQRCASVQHQLMAEGFQATAVMPSKPAAQGRTLVTAIWTRTRNQLSWAPPYYMNFSSDGLQEVLLAAIRLLCSRHELV